MNALTVDLGTMRYRECAQFQRDLLEAVADGDLPDLLLTVQHPPVFTLGSAFKPEHLLQSVEELNALGYDVEKTDRGGDVTYHGPGQLVVYPIFDVGRHGRDLHRWIRNLEEAVLKVVADFGLEGRRFPPHTGVWVGDRKICALGIRMRRWVSMHGIALNVENALDPFALIVPCGIADYGVTSLAQETARAVGLSEVTQSAERAFAQVFGLDLHRASLSELTARLDLRKTPAS